MKINYLKLGQKTAFWLEAIASFLMAINLALILRLNIEKKFYFLASANLFILQAFIHTKTYDKTYCKLKYGMWVKMGEHTPNIFKNHSL